MRTIGYILILLLANNSYAATIIPAGSSYTELKNVITDSDPSKIISLDYVGTRLVSMRDSSGGFGQVQAFIFYGVYTTNPKIEYLVHPEYGSSDAAKAAIKDYARMIGQLPTCELSKIAYVSLNKNGSSIGDDPWNHGIQIQDDFAQGLVSQGVMEEVLIHEGVHASWDLDFIYTISPKTLSWVTAQVDDGVFFSNYAMSYPYREDLEESFLAYFSQKFRSERITSAVSRAIKEGMKNRIKFFDYYSFCPNGLSD